MNVKNLEQYLERGDLLGFVKQIHSPDLLGWILLNKQKLHERFLSLLDRGERPEFEAEQAFIRENPYHLSVIEVRRDAYESERYETNEDYPLNEHYALEA